MLFTEYRFYQCLRKPLCRLMQLAVLRLKQIFSRSIYKCDFVDSSGEKISFPEILIVSLYNSIINPYILSIWYIYSQDLSQYDNDELLHESLHLLGRIFSAEENLFEKAIQTQVSISIQLCVSLCVCLYNSVHSVYGYDIIVHVFIMLQQLLITPESESICDDVLAKLPRLRHYAQIDVMEKQYLELVEILNTFTRQLC